MNLKTKRFLTYGTIAFFNLSTGIGYAIIFPTIWNYIHERYNGTGPMLGLIISAYSISSFFSNPLVGFWADKTQNTKFILALAVVMEIAGSLMYFFGISVWFLVASRLIAGFGGGGGAAVFGDITRTTSETERTAALALVVSFRQFGLIVGPALNLFLSKSNFNLGLFPVDKYTSPGLFMAVLWTLVELAVFTAYYNLTVLKNDEQVEQLFPGYYRTSSYSQDILQPGDMESSSSIDTGWGCEPNIAPARSERFTENPLYTSSHSIPPELLNEFKENPEIHTTNISTISCKSTPHVCDNPLLYTHLDHKDVDHRPSVTDTMIESAERFIQSSETAGNVENVAPIPERKTRSWESAVDRAISIIQPLPQVSPIIVPDGEDSSNISHKLSNREYLRDEVVVLLGLAFISSFAQTVLETVVTPLAQKYYNFSEMENSFIYLLAGIEAILVFVCIRSCSRKVSDRVLLLFGMITLCVAMGIPLLFVPSAELGKLTTLPYFIITIMIDLIGIATVVVCTSSLLSKVIGEEHQAFFQGLRRSMVSLGCVLGPLWGGAFLNRVYLLFAIPLGVSLLIGVNDSQHSSWKDFHFPHASSFKQVLFISSFTKLKPSNNV